MSKNEFVCDCTAVHKDALEYVKERMCSVESAEKIAAFFKIMGDITRMKILWALDKKELCVCDIANLLSMTKSAISHQLAELRKANLVAARREGKTVFYSLSDGHVRDIIEIAMCHIEEE